MITVSIPGLTARRQQIQAVADRTANLQPGLLRAGIVVLKAAADRIDAGGPGWAPNLAGTPLLHQTGRLLASLTIGAAGNVDDVDSNSIKVGTNVKYAPWLQIGTGIFGPKGEPITAKNGGMLAFTSGGQKFVRRSVKGVPPRPFLYVDQQTAESVRDAFAKYILGGITEDS